MLPVRWTPKASISPYWSESEAIQLLLDWTEMIEPELSQNTGSLQELLWVLLYCRCGNEQIRYKAHKDTQARKRTVKLMYSEKFQGI